MGMRRLPIVCVAVSAVLILQAEVSTAVSTFWKARRLTQNETASLASQCHTVEARAWSLPCCVARCQQGGNSCTSIVFCDSPPLCCLRLSNGSSSSSVAVTSPLVECHQVALLPTVEAPVKGIDNVTNDVMEGATNETTTLGERTHGEISSPCGNSGECAVNGSECRNGTCQCVAGYHFYPGPGTCVSSCPKGYGTTFYKVVGFCLNGNNDLTDLSGMPEEQCLALCTADPKCRSFEWGPTRCHLSYTTVLEHPADWKLCTQMDYYQRDCA